MDEATGEFHYKGLEKYGPALDVPNLDVTLLGTRSVPDVPFDVRQNIECGGFPQNSEFVAFREARPFAFVYPRVDGIPDQSQPPIAIICKGTHTGRFGYNGVTVGQSGGSGYQGNVQNSVLVGTSGLDEDQNGVPEQWFVVVPFGFIRRELNLPVRHKIDNPIEIIQPQVLEPLNLHLADADWFLDEEVVIESG